MKWLLTVRVDVNLQRLADDLALLGFTVDLGSCVPLDSGEQVVEAEGPAELGATLERASVDVLKASPSSELELYPATEDEGSGTSRESESDRT